MTATEERARRLASAIRSAMRICGACGGSGSLLSNRWGLTWWKCPCCGGAGVEATSINPPMIGRRSR